MQHENPFERLMSSPPGFHCWGVKILAMGPMTRAKNQMRFENKIDQLQYEGGYIQTYSTQMTFHCSGCLTLTNNIWVKGISLQLQPTFKMFHNANENLKKNEN